MLQSFLISALAAQYPENAEELFLARFPGPWLVWEPGKWAPATPERQNAETNAIRVSTQLRRAEPTAALAIHLQLPRGASEVTLGREPTCTISLNDTTLSRIHLLFAPGPAGWTVTDNDSRNGSSLDGKKLTPRAPAVLRDGAEIDAAEVLLTFAISTSLFRRVRRSTLLPSSTRFHGW